MENRGLPDGSGGEAAAAQPTRGLGVSTAETRLVGLGRKEEWERYRGRENRGVIFNYPIYAGCHHNR